MLDNFLSLLLFSLTFYFPLLLLLSFHSFVHSFIRCLFSLLFISLETKKDRREERKMCCASRKCISLNPMCSEHCSCFSHFCAPRLACAGCSALSVHRLSDEIRSATGGRRRRGRRNGNTFSIWQMRKRYRDGRQLQTFRPLAPVDRHTKNVRVRIRLSVPISFPVLRPQRKCKNEQKCAAEEWNRTRCGEGNKNREGKCITRANKRF